MSEYEKSAAARKVHALFQRTTDKGCTEHEALEAAKLAGKLIDKFQLTMTDIQIKTSECVLRKIPTGSKKSRGSLDNLVVSLAEYSDVKIWFNGGMGTYSIFGLMQDTDLFEYVFDIIKDSFEFELQKHLLERGLEGKQEYGVKKKIRASFALGFCHRMSDRLSEMKKDRVTEIERTGRSLVLIKSVHIEDEYKKQIGIKLSSYKYVGRASDYSANSAGYSAANNVQINSGVSSTKIKGLLK